MSTVTERWSRVYLAVTPVTVAVSVVVKDIVVVIAVMVVVVVVMIVVVVVFWIRKSITDTGKGLHSQVVWNSHPLKTLPLQWQTYCPATDAILFRMVPYVSPLGRIFFILSSLTIMLIAQSFSY